MVLEFFQSALVNSTIGVQALRGSRGDHEMIAGLMGPTLLAIGIAMLVNARHFPEMAKQIGNDPGLIFVSGILLLVAGLAIVRVHNVWSGD